MPRKVYLGDAVYAAIEDEVVILTTENGIAETNRIVLDADTLSKLFLFLDVDVRRRRASEDE